MIHALLQYFSTIIYNKDYYCSIYVTKILRWQISPTIPEILSQISIPYTYLPKITPDSQSTKIRVSTHPPKKTNKFSTKSAKHSKMEKEFNVTQLEVTKNFFLHPSRDFWSVWKNFFLPLLFYELSTNFRLVWCSNNKKQLLLKQKRRHNFWRNKKICPSSFGTTTWLS